MQLKRKEKPSLREVSTDIPLQKILKQYSNSVPGGNINMEHMNEESSQNYTQSNMNNGNHSPNSQFYSNDFSGGQQQQQLSNIIEQMNENKEILDNFLMKIGPLKSQKLDPEPIKQLLKIKFEPLTQYEQFINLYEIDIQKMISSKQVKKNWNQDDILLLIWITQKYCDFYKINIQDISDQNWEEISQIMPGKSFESCKFKWLQMSKINASRIPWTKKENSILRELVKQNTSQNAWVEISKELFKLTGEKIFRSSKQCREHYNNFLDPSLKNTQWTLEEDTILIQMQEQMGNKWSEISKMLPGRTDNSVKNRYMSLKNKKCDTVEALKLYYSQKTIESSRSIQTSQKTIPSQKKQDAKYQQQQQNLQNKVEQELKKKKMIQDQMVQQQPQQSPQRQQQQQQQQNYQRQQNPYTYSTQQSSNNNLRRSNNNYQQYSNNGSTNNLNQNGQDISSNGQWSTEKIDYENEIYLESEDQELKQESRSNFNNINMNYDIDSSNTNQSSHHNLGGTNNNNININNQNGLNQNSNNNNGMVQQQQQQQPQQQQKNDFGYSQTSILDQNHIKGIHSDIQNSMQQNNNNYNNNNNNYNNQQQQQQYYNNMNGNNNNMNELNIKQENAPYSSQSIKDIDSQSNEDDYIDETEEEDNSDEQKDIVNTMDINLKRNMKKKNSKKIKKEENESEYRLLQNFENLHLNEKWVPAYVNLETKEIFLVNNNNNNNNNTNNQLSSFTLNNHSNFQISNNQYKRDFPEHQTSLSKIADNSQTNLQSQHPLENILVGFPYKSLESMYSLSPTRKDHNGDGIFPGPEKNNTQSLCNIQNSNQMGLDENQLQQRKSSLFQFRNSGTVQNIPYITKKDSINSDFSVGQPNNNSNSGMFFDSNSQQMINSNRGSAQGPFYRNSNPNNIYPPLNQCDPINLEYNQQQVYQGDNSPKQQFTLNNSNNMGMEMENNNSSNNNQQQQQGGGSKRGSLVNVTPQQKEKRSSLLLGMNNQLAENFYVGYMNKNQVSNSGGNSTHKRSSVFSNNGGDQQQQNQNSNNKRSSIFSNGNGAPNINIFTTMEKKEEQDIFASQQQ